MKARTATRTSSALRKIRPHTTCSLRVRMKRSATPLVSGSRTKAKLGVMPRKAIWVWTWSDKKALPWSWRSRRPQAASARTAPQAVWMARSTAGRREAVGLFGDVPAERLGIPVLDDHEEGDVAILNGRDHRRVRAPHHAGRVGGDASVVVVDWPLRAAVRREQSILAHEAQHPVPADAEAIEGAQAGPDLAVPLAGEGRAIEVAADRLEQPRIVDHRPRPSPPARGRCLGDRPGGVEGGARHAPGGTNPPHAVGLAGRWGARGGHQRDLLRAKGPGRSMRARSNSTSLESSPIRRWASASSRSAGSSERSRSPVLSPARARACQRSNCQTGTPNCRETASTGSPRSRRSTTSCLRAKLQRWPGASGPAPAACPVMDSMDEPRSPSRPTSPAASIIVFPLPSTLFVLQLLGTIRCPEKPQAAQSGAQRTMRE